MTDDLEQNRTAIQAVEAYDRGDTLWTVEMGGLGPGYEQCIQVGVMELIRRLGGKPLPTFDDTEAGQRAWWDWGSGEISAADKAFSLGLSGAQAGAIKSLAYRAMRDGWDAMVRSAPEDRRIQFSKHFPRVAGEDLHLGAVYIGQDGRLYQSRAQT